MELKDAILSTLAEIDKQENSDDNIKQQEIISTVNQIEKKIKNLKKVESIVQEKDVVVNSNELQFLEELRERMLVLFEGFQSPNNRQIEAKIDLTLNFLEYLLATIDERVKLLDKRV